MENRNILIFLVVVVAVFILMENFTGRNITGGYANEGGRGIQTCRDSDGVNKNIKGTVITTSSGSVKQYDDRCSGGDGLRVMENYCDNNRRAFTYEWCDNGYVCSDGRCMKTEFTNFYGQR